MSLAFDPKCDSFCAVVYYTHILGDYDEADNYKKLALLIPLAGHDGTDNSLVWLYIYKCYSGNSHFHADALFVRVRELFDE